MSFFNELSNRIAADSPLWFKRIGRLGVGFSAGGASMLATGALPASVHVPAMLGTVGGYLLVAGIVAKSVAATACANPDDLKK